MRTILRSGISLFFLVGCSTEQSLGNLPHADGDAGQADGAPSSAVDTGPDAAVKDASVDVTIGDANVDAQTDGFAGDANVDAQTDGSAGDVSVIGIDAAVDATGDALLDAVNADASVEAGGSDSAVDGGSDAVSGAEGGADATPPALEYESHTLAPGCAIRPGGSLKCWGSNFTGELGLGDTFARGDNPGEMGDALPAVDLGTGRKVVSIARGYLHSCALLDNATVKCWGLGLSTGTYGDGPGEMGDTLVPIDFGFGQTVMAISTGGHACAILADGSVKCWGSNDYGQLGLGDAISRLFPSDVVPLGTGRKAIAISAGYKHTCAVLDDRSVKCWGKNASGQLGLGDTKNRGEATLGEMGDYLPKVNLGTGRTAVSISAGEVHTCVLLDNATVKCWGAGANGLLGIGSTADRGDAPNEMGDALPPINFGPGRTTLAISCGYSSSCAILDDHSVKCWGNNVVGQLGVGDNVSRGGLPADVGTFPAVNLGTGRKASKIAVSNGISFACALLDDGTIRCWGENSVGSLGIGYTDARGDGPNEMGDNLPIVYLGK